MQRRIVDFELTPRANAKVGESTRLMLLTALSQLRHKLCSEIAAVEELLGAAGSTPTHPLPVTATPAPLRSASPSSNVLALPMDLEYDSPNVRRAPRSVIGMNFDSQEASDNSPRATPVGRPRARSPGNGMVSDLQDPLPRRSSWTLSRTASMAPIRSGSQGRSQRTDFYDMYATMSSSAQSMVSTGTDESKEMDAHAEHASAATCSTDARGSPGSAGSDAVGSSAGTRSDALVRGYGSGSSCGFSGPLVGRSPVDANNSEKHVCSVLTQNDMAARRSADVFARRKRTMMEAALQDASQSRWMIRRRCFLFTHGKPFEAWFAVMILINSAVLAAEVQFNSANIGDPQPWAFRIAGYIFNFMFLFELVCRIVAEGICSFYTSPGSRFWAAIDTFVVLTSVLETAQSAITEYTETGSDSGTRLHASNVRILKIMRMVRVLRSFRAFRLIRIMTSLQTLVVSILATLRSIVWAGLLIVFVMYVFGITFTDCACDGAADLDSPDVALLMYYWGSLGRSMASLFQAIANGISWRESYETLNEVSFLCGWLYLGFISFTYFVLLNVITGVFCNAAIDLAKKNPDIVAQSISSDVENVRKLFAAVDSKGSGSITIEELEALLNDELTRAQFCAVGLDVRDAWTIFKLMDVDKNGSISESEFVSGIEALKGGAKNIDLTALRMEVRIANRKLLEKLEACRPSTASSVLGSLPSRDGV